MMKRQKLGSRFVFDLSIIAAKDRVMILRLGCKGILYRANQELGWRLSKRIRLYSTVWALQANLGISIRFGQWCIKVP